MDHGVLNGPLAKRGNIDKQIEAYKREQTKAREASAKASRAARREEIANAKRILLAITETPGLLDQKAQERGIERKTLLDTLKRIASLSPAAMVAFERDWLAA